MGIPPYETFFARNLRIDSPPQGDLVRRVHDAIQQRIRKGRIRNCAMPGISGELAGDEGRPRCAAVIDHLQESPRVGDSQWRQPPLVQEQQICLGEPREQAGIGPVRLGTAARGRSRARGRPSSPAATASCRR
jgi:hypothetical protein